MERKLVKILIIKSLLILIIIILGEMICFAQQAKINKIVSETADDVEFQIYLNKPSVNYKEDLVVNYTVKNKNDKTIFLVIESPTVLRMKDIWFAEAVEPVRPPGNLNNYNYEFIRISPNNIYSGKLTLKANEFTSKPGYTFTEMFLRVGFSYTFNISSQRNCKAENRFYCLSDLYKNAKSLMIGDLAIDIIYK